MFPPKFQHCVNGCCYFIDGKLVRKPEYEAALQQHKALETTSICFQLKPPCQDMRDVRLNTSRMSKRVPRKIGLTQATSCGMRSSG